MLTIILNVDGISIILIIAYILWYICIVIKVIDLL